MYPFMKFANANGRFAAEIAQQAGSRVAPFLSLVGAGAVGAGSLHGYNKYQEYLQQKEQKRKELEAAQNPMSGLDRFISPDRQGATGIGALLGAGLGGYLGYNRDQDPRSAILGALTGAGLGGGVGYVAAPYFKKQGQEILDESKRIPTQDPMKAAAAQMHVVRLIKEARKHTPIVSEQQRKLFGAVASGKAKLPGLSKAEAGRHLAESKGKDLPKWHRKKSDAQQYVDEFQKIASGDYDYDLRREPNEDDKTAILTYLKLMQDLDDGKFHTFVVQRGLHPDAAEEYVYQVMHEFLKQKEVPEQKTAAGTNFLGGILKTAEADMGAPVIPVQPQERSLAAHLGYGAGLGAAVPAVGYAASLPIETLRYHRIGNPAPMRRSLDIARGNLPVLAKAIPRWGLYGGVAGLGLYGAKRLLDAYYNQPEGTKTASAGFLDSLVKFADGDEEAGRGLRSELTNEDKIAINEYIRATPGLIDANFHAFVEARGVLPGAAETYTYNLLQRMLEEESNTQPESKEAAGTGFLRKLSTLGPTEDPSLSVQILDAMARHPYAAAALAAAPAYVLGRGAGKGIWNLSEWIARRAGAQGFVAFPTLPHTAVGIGAALGALPLGYLGSEFAQYALNNPAADLNVAGSIYNAPQTKDYIQ